MPQREGAGARLEITEDTDLGRAPADGRRADRNMGTPIVKRLQFPFQLQHTIGVSFSQHTTMRNRK